MQEWDFVGKVDAAEKPDLDHISEIRDEHRVCRKISSGLRRSVGYDV